MRLTTSLLLLNKGDGKPSRSSSNGPMADRVLVVCRTVQIHPLNLHDGSPYGGPHSNQTTCEIPSPFDRIFVFQLAVTCSRVVMFASNLSMGGVGWIVVWDRQAGNPVGTLWV